MKTDWRGPRLTVEKSLMVLEHGNPSFPVEDLVFSSGFFHPGRLIAMLLRTMSAQWQGSLIAVGWDWIGGEEVLTMFRRILGISV